MRSDIEIAQAAQKTDILELAQRFASIPQEALEPYGRFKAKLSLEYAAGLEHRPNGKLILVTAISPTPAGEGKTTTSIGLADALNRIGRKAIVCLREPSIGPVFGMKGGATGGGMAQVVPMEDINLHFTGDFHAIALAHNLLAAMIDNHIHQGNQLGIDPRRITWGRVIDLNDRALRKIVIGLGGAANGVVREDGFDIVAASEVMAIFCLASDRADLRARLSRIVVGYGYDQRAIHAGDLQAVGAMTALLKDALAPNLVQTLEHNLAFVHGGPFANIAHGCNSVIATTSALKLSDYVVTEAGFGADLGMEKFIDIKCRESGLRPDAVVLVATVRALKYHGGVEVGQVHMENLPALREGIVNLRRHIRNIRDCFGLPCVVAINHRQEDTAAELELIEHEAATLGVKVSVARHWSEGGAGATGLANIVTSLCEEPSQIRFAYESGDSLWSKIESVATRVYGAQEVVAHARVKHKLEQMQQQGHGRLPVCIAKTQYSFSTDAKARGAPNGHRLDVRDVRLSAGAGFVVVICGDILTMPGLPREPAAQSIDVDSHGCITGLH